MRKVLEGSIIYRAITAAARWLDGQWSRSFLSAAISGGEEKSSGCATVFSKAAALIHRCLCGVFSALKLDKVFKGSVFLRTFLFCGLALFMAPIAPTMLTLGVVLLGAVSLFLNFALDRERRLFFSPVNKWIWLFGFIYMACTLTSVTLSGSLKSGLLSTAFILFAIVLQNSVTERKQVDGIIYLLVAAGFVVSLYGFSQVLFGVESTTDWIDEDTFSKLTLRVYSTLDNPNVLAEYLLLIIPLGAASAVTAKTSTGRILAGVSTVAMIICMALTYSRGGWLGLIFSVAVFLVLIDRRFIVLGIVAVIGLFFVLPESIMTRLLSIGDLSDSSTSYRLYIWLGTLGMLKDYWFCGVGTGLAAYGAVYPVYSFNAVSAPHSHNLYLQVMCECGIVGIGIFVGLICSFIRTTASALRRTRDNRTDIQLVAVISGMAGFLLQGMTDYSFYNYRVTLMFWIIIALGALLSRSWGEKENTL